MSNYHLFWDGPFSQWHPSDFTYNEMSFTHAEKFMMFYKAVAFNDFESAFKIMNSKSPKQQKELGRGVQGFDIEQWKRIAREIVYAGSVYKFTQNPKLCKELVSTYPKTLVEASPYDKVWGIGLSEYHEDAHNPAKWKGVNWLGEVLTKLRTNIMTGDATWSSSTSIINTLNSKQSELIRKIKLTFKTQQGDLNEHELNTLREGGFDTEQ